MFYQLGQQKSEKVSQESVKPFLICIWVKSESSTVSVQAICDELFEKVSQCLEMDDDDHQRGFYPITSHKILLHSCNSTLKNVRHTIHLQKKGYMFIILHLCVY